MLKHHSNFSEFFLSNLGKLGLLACAYVPHLYLHLPYLNYSISMEFYIVTGFESIGCIDLMVKSTNSIFIEAEASQHRMH